jgi:hypothetical protein
MDLRLVEECKQTMKIVGKQMVVAGRIGRLIKADDLLPESRLETFGNISGFSRSFAGTFASRISR